MKLIADIQFSRELAGFPVGDDSQFHLAQLNGEDQMLCRAFGLHAPRGSLQALRVNDCVCEVLGCRLLLDSKKDKISFGLAVRA